MEGDFFELANRLVNLRGFMIFLIPAAPFAANHVSSFSAYPALHAHTPFLSFSIFLAGPSQLALALDSK